MKHAWRLDLGTAGGTTSGHPLLCHHNRERVIFRVCEVREDRMWPLGMTVVVAGICLSKTRQATQLRVRRLQMMRRTMQCHPALAGLVAVARRVGMRGGSRCAGLRLLWLLLGR